ncbi:MAG: ABC transporter substrate-binding protein [Albidovulum sp.]|nr:ABC transporter substrate-binding protein [Albidovulum sp.]
MKRNIFSLLVAMNLAAVASIAAAQTKINIFSGVSPVFAPPFVAHVNGYFEEEGLDVDVKTFQAGAQAAEAFRSGGAQFLVTCDQPMIAMAAAGDAIIVTQFSDSNNMVFVMGPKGASGPGDLMGKKVGVFRKSGSEFMLEKYMESGGLSIEEVEMVHLAPFDQVPALVNGNVDAISLWKPFDLRVMGLSDEFEILATTGDVGYSLYCGMLASRAYLESAPQGEMQAFMRAVKKGSDFLIESHEEGIETISAFTKLQPSDVAHTIEGVKWELVSDEAFRSQMREIEQFLLRLDILKEPIDWDSAADYSYIRELDPSLVR